MNGKRLSWWLVVGGGVLVGLLLLACLALFLGFVGPAVGSGVGRGFRSNGEQIYFTATSRRDTPITADTATGMMQVGTMTCASCHGSDGRGGRAQMMMRTFVAPDIRYEALAAEEHAEHGEEVMEHEPYTEETIKQAFTQGVEPNGEPLDWPMPRWSMSDQDLDDLVEFLKTLD